MRCNSVNQNKKKVKGVVVKYSNNNYRNYSIKYEVNGHKYFFSYMGDLSSYLDCEKNDRQCIGDSIWVMFDSTDFNNAQICFECYE